MRVFRCVCRQIKLVFRGYRGNRIARCILRCGKPWKHWLFGHLIVYAGAPSAGVFCFLLPVDFGRAFAAVFRPTRVGEEVLAADLTAVQRLRVEDGLLQLRLLRQHGMAEPAADQAVGDGLWAGAIQRQAVAVCVVAAALDQLAHAANLSRRQAEKRAVGQALDGVKSAHSFPPWR